jgi:hypothetical protein
MVRIISLIPLLFIAAAMMVSWGIFSYAKTPQVKPLRVLSIIWTTLFIVELAGHITGHFNIKNHLMYNIYYPFFYMAIAYVYRSQLNRPIMKKYIDYFIFGFPVFVVLNSLFFQTIRSLQTLTIVVGGGFIIIVVLAYFLQLYNSEDNEKITHDPFFWISFGLVTFFGATVPFLGMLNNIYRHFPMFTVIYSRYVANAFSVMLNSLIIVAYLCQKKISLKSHLS